MPTTLERFADLFTGGDQAYGEWDVKRGAKTVHGAPQLENYKRHLDGDVGLGIVPVGQSGTCRFAAIDVDVDTIDHRQLYENVNKRRIPLCVCRSKSGGAHLYIFVRAPGLQSGELRDSLKRWATLLGYPQSEIFPKQVKANRDNIGNWINLPYFSGDATTRYAVGPKGAMGLEEFLDSIQFYESGTSNVDEKVDPKSRQMPPCLAALSLNGVGEGQRNMALFNFAVFYRKSEPANWESALMNHNSNLIQPSLEYRELQGIIHSVGRTKYQYLCHQSPIKELCDRESCLKLPFGVNHMPWEEHGSFDDMVVGNCRKLLTDPPRYIVEVNGRDIVLEWDDLYKYQNFRSNVGKLLDLVIPLMKQPQWEQQLRGLLAKKEDIEAPEDASMTGLVLDRFHEFLTLRERAQNKEDLLRGIPVQDGDAVLFRVGDFRRYLQGYKLDKIEGSQLYLALRIDGCVHRRIRLNGRLVTAWAYPLKKLNEQTKEFAVQDFHKDLGTEEM